MKMRKCNETDIIKNFITSWLLIEIACALFTVHLQAYTKYILEYVKSLPTLHEHM